ncbi:MAG TPA: hypothetical protein PKN21_09095 [Bacteroidales bacterium]|nr:hypothetical protein [Bacteroidales bacterium]
MKKTCGQIAIIFLLTVCYIIEVMIISGILIAFGLHFPELKVSQQVSFIQLMLSELIGAAFALYLVLKYSISGLSVFLILAFILFFSNISVAIEGAIFTPGYITGSVLVSLFVQQLLISVAFSLTAVLLFRKKHFTTSAETVVNVDNSLAVKILVGAVVYMASYYVWGWLNYNLFTKSFYESGVSGLHIPEGAVLIKIILFRGVLITCSVVPFLLFALPGNKGKLFETASILFLFGGIIPMIYTIGMLPVVLIWYSLIEIFLQNFISGLLVYKVFNYQHKA